MAVQDQAPSRRSGQCPITVRRSSMIHRWDQLAFVHWDYDPDLIQRLLPPGLTVDTFEDRARVGLVPFLMQVRPPRGPALGWISNFCETNVRTYSMAADGTRGGWFLSLDTARLAAVITGRTAYRLPYYWSAMTLHTDGDEITYTTRRRWPGPRGTRSLVRVRVGDQYEPDELSDLDHFLTARWRLYSHRPTGLRSALAQHEPWPLHQAQPIDLGDELLTAAGLPPPATDPLIHWSPGVEVRIGYPHRLAPPSTNPPSR